MNKYAGALGVWEIRIDPERPIDLKPTMKDIRKFRNILTDSVSQKNKAILFDNFVTFMFDMIRVNEELSPEYEPDLKLWLELYCRPLFEEAMVAFKYATKKNLEEVNKESIEDLKKQMSDV